MKSSYFKNLCDECIRYIKNNTETIDSMNMVRFSKVSDAYLLSTCFAVLSLSLMNRKDAISDYLGYILGCQREDGYFIDPAFDEKDLQSNHDSMYLMLQFTYFSLLALSTADVKPKFSLSFLKPFGEPGYMKQWLERLDWDKPWLESNNVMFISCLIEHDNLLRESQSVIKAFFATMDAKQNRNTGFWGTDENAILEGMAGAYHFLIPYYFHNHPIQYSEKIIDNTMSLVSFDYLFSKEGGGGACEDLDAVDILCKLTTRTDYRRRDIEQLLEKTLVALLCCQNHDGGFSYRFNPLSFSKGVFPVCHSIPFKVFLANMVNAPLHRWHYWSTWYFSGWKKMPFPLHQSDMWATYARLVSIATISHVMNIYDDWNFLKVPGIGWE